MDEAVADGLNAGMEVDDDSPFTYTAHLFQPDTNDISPDYVMEDLDFTPKTTTGRNAASTTGGGSTNRGLESIKEVSAAVSAGANNQKPVITESGLLIQELDSIDDSSGDEGLVDQNEVEKCLACGANHDIYRNHPFFHGKICRKCKEVLMSASFAVDDDGCSMYCCICGEGGDLYVCDDQVCGKAFCFKCVARHCSQSTVKYVKDTDSWNCFLCTKYSMSTHGSLVPRENWSLEVVKFFQRGHFNLCDDMRYMKPGNKRKLRVLSLFDGIGTGKLVLDELGLDVDVYYASEIEPDAIQVSTYSHPLNLVHIGDADNLNREKLAQLCPIDLVLGGPPCNDLSIVNPVRQGFNGTGMLIMKFVTIVKDIELLSYGVNHVFWLMESTGSMPKRYKKIVNDLIGMKPVVWDAKHFTGQRRARNFWGNIPGMFSTAQYCRQLEKDKKDLNWALISNCNRKARVSHSRTITTSRNSLSITNGLNDGLVSMNGKVDHIWVQEIERLFGYPCHYTDVGEFTHAQRRKLLGKAWSVPVIKHLLSPLKQYFKLKGSVKTKT